MEKRCKTFILTFKEAGNKNRFLIARTCTVRSTCDIFSYKLTHLKPRWKSRLHAANRQLVKARSRQNSALCVCENKVFSIKKESMCIDGGITQRSAINSTFGLENRQKDRKLPCSFFLEYCLRNSGRGRQLRKQRTVEFF